MKQLILSFSFFLLSFLSMGQFQLNGVTVNMGGGTYQLTQPVDNEFGAMWYKLQHNLNNPFNVQGQMNLGSDPGGADGITFVMQNNCLAAGSGGGGLGYSGMPGQSIAVEFDTYQNIAGTGVELNNDPPFDHIAFEKNGDVVHSTVGSPNPDDLFGPVQMDPVLTNLKTGSWYNFQISYNPTTKLLTVYFNNSLRISTVYDLQANIFTNSPWVYWGFTSSTGGHSNLQQIQLDTTHTTHLLQDTTICSGSIPVTLDPFSNLKGTDLALNNPIHASSNQNNAYLAVDGNLGSRWESVWQVDPQWIFVDLQSPTNIDSVTIDWEAAYATSFLLQTSTDSITWTTVYSTTTNPGGHNSIPLVGVTNVRYVRIYGTARSLSSYGYSIWEFSVYGQPHYLWSTNNGSNATISPNIYSSTVTLTPTVTTIYTVEIPDPCVGFTNYSITVTVNCAAPVTLIDFTVQTKNGGAFLQWSTASEHNSQYFEIMKSSDGINFTVIGTVKASGNASNIHDYSYQDNTGISGITYYKLVTVDIDGSKQESEIKEVSKNSKNAFVTNTIFEDQTTLVVNGSKWVEYSILDMLGREVFYASVQNPSDAIPIGQNLPNACYLVRIITDSYQESIKVCKVK
ncbi:MAG TPA: discoidin domain-containing protein [Cytophagaceae bacterium]|jgi:hypothetical protein|nr:discoidin domain-containing protein [Cytophagaceae bacterium]